MSEIADLAILGGGPAGQVAALVAVQRGARVILVEHERVGGACPNAGCIPTKMLTTAADLLVRSRTAGDLGLSIPQVTANLPSLMTRKQNRVVDRG